MSSQYDVRDLLELMDRLRDPETGCPWDLKQDYRSIVPHTVEETYEVADAIERGDLEHLPDELGDLLFQVVFYARLGKEEERFDFDAVVDQVTRKLIRRHPHIFPRWDHEQPTSLSRRHDGLGRARELGSDQG